MNSELQWLNLEELLDVPTKRGAEQVLPTSLIHGLVEYQLCLLDYVASAGFNSNRTHTKISSINCLIPVNPSLP